MQLNENLICSPHLQKNISINVKFKKIFQKQFYAVSTDWERDVKITSVQEKSRYIQENKNYYGMHDRAL